VLSTRLPDCLGQRNTIHAGHDYIRYYQRSWLCRQEAQYLVAAVDSIRGIAGAPEDRDERVGKLRLIINNQYPSGHRVCSIMPIVA
jgi:hypothetical protein